MVLGASAVIEPLLHRIWQLRANVSAYDAVYVALAEALCDVLVTGDRGRHRSRIAGRRPDSAIARAALPNYHKGKEGCAP